MHHAPDGRRVFVIDGLAHAADTEGIQRGLDASAAPIQGVVRGGEGYFGVSPRGVTLITTDLDMTVVLRPNSGAGESLMNVRCLVILK